MLIGIGFVILGESIRIISVQYAGGATRTTKVGAPSLCTSGPYSRSRNPLYFGNVLIYVGMSFIAGGAYLYETSLFIFFYFVFQYSMIISLEEETLNILFPEDYKNYCNNVPRLFPKLKPWTGKDNRIPIHVSKTLRTEKRTFQNIFLMIILLVIKNNL